jgi:hypothetical protein
MIGSTQDFWYSIELKPSVRHVYFYLHRILKQQSATGVNPCQADTRNID